MKEHVRELTARLVEEISVRCQWLASSFFQQGCEIASTRVAQEADDSSLRTVRCREGGVT